MGKKVIVEQLIALFNEIHDNRFDYSKFEYTGSKNKSCIICPDHGEFWQRPNGHKLSGGCPQCIAKQKGKSKIFSQEKALEKCRQVHGDKYQYPNLNYTKAKNKINVLCPIHGEFSIVFDRHTSGGSGCQKCGEVKRAKSKTLTQEQALNKCREVHGDRYDYPNLNYKCAREEVNVVCREHGPFSVIYDRHTSSAQGCPTCSKIKYSESMRSSQECFESKALEVHEGFYSYAKSIYVKGTEKVIITCPLHGDFEQQPNNHLQGQGCPVCRRDKISKARSEDITGWRLSDWFRHGQKSKSFDSYKFYVLKLTDDRTGEEFIKAGRTYQTMAKRYTKSDLGPYTYELIHLVEVDERDDLDGCRYIYKLEKRFMQIWGHLKYQPLVGFGGARECFSIN